MGLFETLKFAVDANVTISFSTSSEGILLHVRDSKGYHIDSIVSSETSLKDDIQASLISLGILKLQQLVWVPGCYGFQADHWDAKETYHIRYDIYRQEFIAGCAGLGGIEQSDCNFKTVCEAKAWCQDRATAITDALIWGQ